MQIVHSDTTTGAVRGVTVVAAWPADEPYPVPHGCENRLIEPDHPIMTEHQGHWRVKDGRLVRKSDAEITAFHQARQKAPMRSDTDVLLDLVNELRQAAGQPELTVEDVRQRQRDTRGAR